MTAGQKVRAQCRASAIAAPIINGLVGYYAFEHILSRVRRASRTGASSKHPSARGP
jgi:hypothetical protein